MNPCWLKHRAAIHALSTERARRASRRQDVHTIVPKRPSSISVPQKEKKKKKRQSRVTLSSPSTFFLFRERPGHDTVRGGSGEDQRRDADQMMRGYEPGVHPERQGGHARLGDAPGA